MAKKEIRRAARGPQKPAQARRTSGGPPTVRGALIQAGIMAGIYLALIEILTRAKGTRLLANLLLAVFFFMLFAVFTYFWQGYLYKKRQARGGGKK
jgi:Kef-type K+ transport system membrane component KefB